MSQKVLVMNTERACLRSEAHGWSCEDSSLYGGEPVGSTTGGARGHYRHPNVMSALHAGWKLLAPPRRLALKNQDGEEFTEYEWWLVKEAAE